ncbi:hypothetical protein Pmani_006949 [Petrolisthes manimaculis]|uniref:Uncharacterized protein n=1 Tax=Petrolisthes manimaculis TaxID=1843537 RepID=A0AAE1Q9D8_9EUCA|nr:hypothetical protein Pmani_006949 [Petrolisthes manimaculis]
MPSRGQSNQARFVWSSSGVPVIHVRPATHQEGEPLDRLVLVKRSAQYDRPSGVPCGFSAYRCPHPDLPALCRYHVPICSDTDFIRVNI